MNKKFFLAMSFIIGVNFVNMSSPGFADQKNTLNPDALKKKLLYQNDFSSEESLKDWILEGPGTVKIENGKLFMHGEFQPVLVKLWEKLKKEKGREEFKWSREYHEYMIKNAGEKYSEMIDREEEAFKGGHVVLWNTFDTPNDYYIEYDFKPLSKAGLFIVFVSAKGDNGKSIFDVKLKKRNGVFIKYTKGDINSYHFSYFANMRGTHRGFANMRKNSGFHKVANGPDLIPWNTKKTHKIQVLKQGKLILFYVDNKLSISYTDDGKFGPSLQGGNVGLRQMSMGIALYDNFKIYSLKE